MTVFFERAVSAMAPTTGISSTWMSTDSVTPYGT